MSFFKRLMYPLTRWLAHNRLNKLYGETAVNPEQIIHFGPQDKFILFSDCHRGDASWKDDYAPNRNLHLYALSDYLRKGFTYIELGDGDELFENKNFDAIAFAHRDTFYQMRDFYHMAFNESGDDQQAIPKFYMLYGNHDIQRRDPQVVKDHFDTFYIEYEEPDKRYKKMFPNLKVHEGLILRYEDDAVSHDVFLVHGHQGDWFNDYLWWLALIVVRYIWGPLQQFIGWRDPTMPPKPYYVDKWGVQQRMTEWVASEKQMMICGHTHHSHFTVPIDSEGNANPLYFNTGSCVHPRAITGIEIQDGAISLVKWELAPRAEDGVLHIVRGVLEGPTPLLAYRKVLQDAQD